MKTKLTLLVVSLAVVFSIVVGFGTNYNIYNKKAPQPKISDNTKNTIKESQIFSPNECILNESFEGPSFPPLGWLKITPTGGTGWEKRNAGTSPIPGFNGGTLTTPPGGGNALAFCNYNTGSGGSPNDDQWLIAPRMVNIQANDSITFWLRKYGNFIDSISVRISITTPSISAMVIPIVTLGFDSLAPAIWIQYKFNIGTLVPPGSNIYIGFREFVPNRYVNGASFSLDLVKSTAIVTEIQNETETPTEFNLSQNYPNPFNPSTNIDYSIPKSGFVSLKIYDMLGKEVAKIVNENKEAGNYTVTFNASKLSSGIYYYKIQFGNFTDIKSMVLIK